MKIVKAMELYAYLKFSRFLIDFQVAHHRRHHRSMIRNLGHCTWCESARECLDLVTDDGNNLPYEEGKKWPN